MAACLAETGGEEGIEENTTTTNASTTYLMFENEKADPAKVCQILKFTYYCLCPMTKMYIRLIEGLRKSQVGMHFHKGKQPILHAMTGKQIEFMDECLGKSEEFIKMDLDKDSFFMYIVTGRIPEVSCKSFVHRATMAQDPLLLRTSLQRSSSIFCNQTKIKNKREFRREQRRNRNKGLSTTAGITAAAVDDDEVNPTPGFKEKSERMFKLYAFLSDKRSEMEEVIKYVDPLKKTCLRTLFRSKECDRWQKIVRELTKNLDLAYADPTEICSCGSIEDMVAKKLKALEPIKAKRGCKCSHCGMEMTKVFQKTVTNSSSSNTTTTSSNNKTGCNTNSKSSKTTNENESQNNNYSPPSKIGNPENFSFGVKNTELDSIPNEDVVSLVVRMTGEESASVLDLLSQHNLGWDYSAVKVERDSLSISLSKREAGVGGGGVSSGSNNFSDPLVQSEFRSTVNSFIGKSLSEMEQEMETNATTTTPVIGSKRPLFRTTKLKNNVTINGMKNVTMEAKLTVTKWCTTTKNEKQSNSGDDNGNKIDDHQKLNEPFVVKKLMVEENLRPPLEPDIPIPMECTENENDWVDYDDSDEIVLCDRSCQTDGIFDEKDYVPLAKGIAEVEWNSRKAFFRKQKIRYSPSPSPLEN